MSKGVAEKIIAEELRHHTDSFMTLTCGTGYLAEHIAKKLCKLPSLGGEEMEDRLVRLLCSRNGWKYGGGEDYDIAVEDVKWFIEKYTELVKV